MPCYKRVRQTETREGWDGLFHPCDRLHTFASLLRQLHRPGYDKTSNNNGNHVSNESNSIHYYMHRSTAVGTAVVASPHRS